MGRNLLYVHTFGLDDLFEQSGNSWCYRATGIAVPVHYGVHQFLVRRQFPSILENCGNFSGDNRFGLAGNNLLRFIVFAIYILPVIVNSERC